MVYINAVKNLSFAQVEAVFSHFMVDDLDAKIEDQIQIINKFSDNNQNALRTFKQAKTEGLRLKAANNELEGHNIDYHKKLLKTETTIEELSKSIRQELAELNIDREIKEEDAKILEKAQGIMEEKYLTKIS